MSHVWQSWRGGSQTVSKRNGGMQMTDVYYQGTDDINAASIAILAWLPAVVPDIVSGFLMLESVGPIERVGEGFFQATARYLNEAAAGSYLPNPPAMGEFKIEWDFTPTAQHINFSQEGKWTPYLGAALGGVDPNPWGAINFRKHDGKIEVDGIDVRIQSMKFTVLYRPLSGVVTSATARALRAKELHRNNAPFLGWQKHELLFVGGNASQAVLGPPEIRVEFETDIQETIPANKLGDIPAITKPPHDYLDVVYDTTPDDTGKRLAAKPIAAYVHHLYGETNFPTLFGFGP